DGLRKDLRRGLQRAARVEEASGRQDAGDDPQFGRHLRDELPRPRQGRRDGVRGSARPAGHPARLLAASYPLTYAQGRSFAGDVGLPGPDEGKGGKFLILPPGYKGAVPSGYFVYRSDTRIWFFTDYYSISPGMISQTPGNGARY